MAAPKLVLQIWPRSAAAVGTRLSAKTPDGTQSWDLLLQVLHGDSPSRILVRDTHAQNFDYDAGHTGLLCDRWRDLSTDQRTIEQVGKGLCLGKGLALRRHWDSVAWTSLPSANVKRLLT